MYPVLNPSGYTALYINPSWYTQGRNTRSRSVCAHIPSYLRRFLSGNSSTTFLPISSLRPSAPLPAPSTSTGFYVANLRVNNVIRFTSRWRRIKFRKRNPFLMRKLTRGPFVRFPAVGAECAFPCFRRKWRTLLRNTVRVSRAFNQRKFAVFLESSPNILHQFLQPLLIAFFIWILTIARMVNVCK